MKLPFIIARRFVAGETFEKSIPKIKELNHKNIRVTLDLLGENVTDKKTAIKTVEEYIRLLHQIENAGLRSSISIKLTMLGLTINKEFCKKNLFRLLEETSSLNQFVRIDMEGSDYTQETLNLFREAFSKYGDHVGIVLQAYLHRTKHDIDELAKMGADVRLCKGAYKEPQRIALQHMPAIRKAFKEYAGILFDQTPFPRIATHDDELIRWVINYTKQMNLSPSRFEFQMLYGLREETITDLAEKGYQTRIYVPFGTMWFPYFKRRLMERKENIWFILSTMFRK